MTPGSKAELRRAALQQRAAVPQDVREAFAVRAAREGLVLARGHESRVAAAYWPIRGEADPLPLLKGLAAAGLTTALPIVAGRGKPLIFRGWSPGDPLADGPFGLREPAPQSPPVEPDLLFVPLAAFDRAGHRVGYGAGYYDATLATLAAKRPLAIGLAFATQEVARVPAEPHDHPLAFVITERETIACGVSSDHASSVHR
ncbi:MAG: 5-formyltetrahydrofolate cyclo-ligase [Methylobacteriaceae bacterium]|jgi:5-formyltetrahydrofolate cyclo-ligase|nr:5-formyltetrahydrofolate cyclo-ligase [Methylobacteriaceae bacterium]